MLEKEIAVMGEQCIQESPVFCNNECPALADVRLMMEKVQKGDFTGAFKLYQKQVIFPDIISRICDEPCKKACVRKDIDDPLSIRLIEKASCDFTKSRDFQRYTMPPKKGKIVVIGGGLTGLSCAINLSRKSYDVTLYEKNNSLGGRLWQYPNEVLPKEILEQTFSTLLEDEDIKFHLNCEIKSLSELDCDVIFVATGFEGSTFDLKLKDKRPVFDKVSMKSSKDNVFVAGGVLKNTKDYSPIYTISEGLRVAKSLERFLKGSSLTLGREYEDYSPTSLITKTDNINTISKIIPLDVSQGFTKEQAIAEANRCLLCECKVCTKGCELLSHYKSYPKAYVKDIMQSLTALDGISKNISCRFINSCNLCGLCKEVCPTDVDMSDICVSSRHILHKGGKLPPAYHDFWLRDMYFSFSDLANLNITAPEKEKCDYVFFPGCQLGASDPMYVTKTYDYLRTKLNNNVSLCTDCCGAPAQWGGYEEIHSEALEKIRNDINSISMGKVIMACPTCIKMFKQYLPEFEIISLWQIIDKYGLSDDTKLSQNKKIAVFDPCSSRYDPDTQSSIRSILKKSGFDINELLYNGQYAQCCSYGGLIYSANPKLADKIVQKRTQQSPYPYVTYCTNCRDTFATDNKETWHILDILFSDDLQNRSIRKPPDISKRRQNRINLKNNILKDILGEDMKIQKQEYENIDLIITDELLIKLERSLISTDDIKNVILHAEKTGNKLENKPNNSFIAHLQQGIITYWAEYQIDGSKYKLINAYSHRLQIKEELTNESK